MCNNAGFGTVAPLPEADLEREQRVVRLNVEAVHHLTGAFLPRMVGDGAGAVLNVASTAAFQPLPGFATYAASKAFVQSFSEAVHAELSGTGVSVTCLCPGFTRTEFGENARAADKEASLPGFLFMEAGDVAREGVDGMVAGRRTVIPGLQNRASMLGGRAAAALAPAPARAPGHRPLGRRRLRAGLRQQLAGHAVGRAGRAAEQPPVQLRAAEVQRRVVLPRRADAAVDGDLRARGVVERLAGDEPERRRGERELVRLVLRPPSRRST